MNQVKYSMIKKIINFIGKDTSSENESKKVIVINNAYDYGRGENPLQRC